MIPRELMLMSCVTATVRTYIGCNRASQNGEQFRKNS